MDNELSDTDADGDNESDQKVSGLKFFEKNHPYLEQNTRRNHPITVLVEDSDDEMQESGDDDDDDDDESESDEAYDRPINPDHWNWTHYAFGRYLLTFLDPRGRSYAHLDDEYFEEKIPYDPFENDDDDDEEGEPRDETYVEEGSMEEAGGVRSSTPALTRSSSRCDSSLPPSSPAQPLSSSPVLLHSVTFDANHNGDDDPSPPSSIDPLSLSPNSSLELHPSIIASHYPNKKYTSTPAPPIARNHRLQLERMERRMERGKSGTYLCECDEVVDDEGDEVDELFEEEEGECSDEEDGKWVRPVLEDGEVWDPFGDEEEV
jgi:hypothetical protein